MKTLTLAVLLLLGAISQAFGADISQEYKYQVLVKENVNGIEYRDAIYYTPSEWATLTQKEVNDEIAVRVTNFDNAIKNPPAPYVPSKAELQAQKADLEAQIVYLNGEISKK